MWSQSFWWFIHVLAKYLWFQFQFKRLISYFLSISEVTTFNFWAFQDGLLLQTISLLSKYVLKKKKSQNSHLVFWCLEELWVPDLTDTSKTKGRQGREDGEERWKVKARCSCTIVQYLPIPRAFSVDFKQVERFAVSSLTLTSHKGFPSLKTILRPFTIWNICPTQLPPYYRSLIICQVTHCCLLIRSWIWSCSSGICSLFLFFRLKGRAFQTFPAALIR